MKTRKENTTRSFVARWYVMVPLAAAFFFAAPCAFAQNSKGDKPARQSPVLRFPKVKRHSKGGDRAVTSDISGRRKVRTKNQSSASHIIYGNRNPESKRRTSRGDHAAPPRFKVRVRSVSAQRARANVYPQKGPYVNNPSKTPKKVRAYNRTVSGKRIIKNYPNNDQRAWNGNLKGEPIGAPSVSRPYVTRGRRNVYWGKFSKGEKPIVRDLTGRPVRTRNFHSLSPGTGVSDTGQVARKPSREGSNFGKIRGGYSSISDRNGRAWTGDISGHRLRRRLAQQGRGGRGLFSGFRSISGRSAGGRFTGFRSASGRGGNQPLPVRKPGMGASGIARMLRKLGGRREFGGGSAEEVGGFRGDLTRADLNSTFGSSGMNYKGRIRANRPVRGGGSVSGKVFNNNGLSLTVRPPGAGFGAGTFKGNLLRQDVSTKGFNRDGSGYSGNIKTGRPVRGGGSVSGKIFNNNGRALSVRPPGGGLGAGTFKGNLLRQDVSTKGFNRDGSGYSGSIKAQRPLHGGGSISGKMFNNGGRALNTRPPGRGSWAIGNFRGIINKDDLDPLLDKGVPGYSGTMRGHRPLKGGGSVSGKYAGNNGGKPLLVKPPGRGSWPIGNYHGRTRLDAIPEIRKEGSDFAGNIKAHKPLHGGGSISGKMWNNDGKPITAKAPISGSGLTYSGKTALPRFKRYYVQNPHSAHGALKKVRPSAVTHIIGGLTTREKMHAYLHNPSSNKNALKTWSPGVAYARLKDYQGNMKMNKLTGRLHPDSQFAHGNMDNVKNERSIKTNIKLLWAKLFKKNGGQPEIVKTKEHVPRYDKKEKDLWKALYD